MFKILWGNSTKKGGIKLLPIGKIVKQEEIEPMSMSIGIMVVSVDKRDFNKVGILSILKKGAIMHV
ncbi:hypothetical protein COM96_28305 [Bacillus cereus]|uniref:Uncharacterized protein n=1 Tax=Bacillus cereus TaxID=1396 RepID=A0A2A7HPJ1_BACCE|nr:hypothetical protein COM96_28305 [Bacillus cereus]